MPLQATSGAASYDAFGGGVPAVPQYIEDVFSSYLWTGNDSSQTITNGIDLAGKGGLVWIKSRSQTYSHILSDTNRGTGKFLSSNTTDAQGTDAQDVTAFNTTGFTVGNNSRVNNSSFNYASWSWAKAPKFFDVVTWSGNDASNRQIAHNLGSVPGCIIVKTTGTATDWNVYHRSLGNTKALYLNLTQAQETNTNWGNTTPTSSVFTTNLNGAGNDYIAYLFAHDAGGFGLTGTDNVISCGSFTCPSSGGVDVNLGYEPQYILMKKVSGAENWVIYDIMRGWAQLQQSQLYPNITQAEDVYAGNNYFFPTATGFRLNSSFGLIGDYIYIAIRRGPMKVPTSGTSVFKPLVRTGTGSDVNVTGVGFAPDFAIVKARDGREGEWFDRLRGKLTNLRIPGTYDEQVETNSLTGFDFMDGVSFGSDSNAQTNASGVSFINHFFKRAPSVFDVVCYTGTGSGRTVTHNLGVAPEFMIIKSRNTTQSWITYSLPTGNENYGILNTTVAWVSGGSFTWNNTFPTNTVFSLGASGALNGSGDTYVAYLFATCAGVSKVGSYTGTATTKQIDCGFTGGARFVLIKRTDSTGSWYVWDSARGIVSGNDPYLLINTADAEVTSTDYIDTYSAGFEISSTAPAAINASGGTFVFLAIA